MPDRLILLVPTGVVSAEAYPVPSQDEMMCGPGICAYPVPGPDTHLGPMLYSTPTLFALQAQLGVYRGSGDDLI